jgi:hypothetical protein
MALSKEQILSVFDNRLTKVDSEIIRPLHDYTWTRDIPFTDDLSKTVRALALTSIVGIGQGTSEAAGRSWVGEHADDLKGVDVAMSANAVSVYTAGREAKWSSMELEQYAEAGNIAFDTEQVEVINDIFQQEAQEVGYLGDSAKGIGGLLNSVDRVETVKGSGVLSDESADWDAVVAEIDKQFQAARKNAANVLTPSRMLVSPDVYIKLFSMKAPYDKRYSMIDYIEQNSLGRVQNGSMKVLEVKELAGIGTGKKDRVLFYTPDKRYVNYHIRSLWREKTYDRGLNYCAAYMWRLSELQLRRPETLFYVDGL